jgi:hypothetical protein
VALARHGFLVVRLNPTSASRVGVDLPQSRRAG